MGDFAKPLGRVFGIGEGQGEYFQPNNANPALEVMGQRNGVANNNPLAALRAQYGTGQMSAEDLMKALQGTNVAGVGSLGANNNTGAMTQAMADVATDPISGSRFASEQVQSNPILGQLFGQGGEFGKSLAEADQLRQQGYKFTPDDMDALGQASGNVARLYGQQEQQLAQALADRGLSASPSGAAGVAYSGLMGNKFEQLANSQRQIADQRYSRALQRQGQLQQYNMGMGNLGANAIQQQYNRQLQGAQNGQDALSRQAQFTIAQNQGANTAGLDSMQDKRGAYKSTGGDFLAGGLDSSLYNVGAAPGQAASKTAGQGGSALSGAGAAFGL